MGGGSPPRTRNKGLLKEKLELERFKTRGGATRVTLKPIDDKLTFDKGFYVFIRALQLLRAHNQGVVLVGLGGASGSGKTAFSEKVKAFMPGIAVISMDNFNDGSKVVDSNFDDPRLTDYDLLLQNLADLQQGKPAEIPIYDFKSSSRVGFTTLPVPESRVVIIEGIYALSDRLKPLLDLRVSITGGVHFDLVKRVIRDINRSGQGPEEIIQQITDTVFPMYKTFIEPDLKAAQLKIHNSFNPFTGFMNATYILKAPRGKDLTQEAVVAVLGADAVVKTESEMCDIHLLPPNEDPETCASWLRMRNRDGRYTLMFEEWVTEGNFIISPRIQFEVSVRVLGGLMALGYEVGTVMRRTSTAMTAGAGDVAVKFDDVENLGTYVQVQGKDRARVAAVAEALKLCDYIPRSYIEQVQLSKLVQDFQNPGLTAEMKKRFSVDAEGRSSLALDDAAAYGDLLSPTRARGGGGSRYGGGRSTHHHASLREHADHSPGGSPGNDGLLSTSAPVWGSSPIAIKGPHHNHNNNSRSGAGGGASTSGRPPPGAAATAAAGAAGGSTAASPSSSVAAAAGSTLGPPSILLSDEGSIPGSIDSGSGAAALAAAAAGCGAGSGSGSGNGGSARAAAAGMPRPGAPAATSSGGGAGSSSSHSKGGGLLGQQLRNSRTGSNSNLAGLDTAAAAAGSGGGVAASPVEQMLRLSAAGGMDSTLLRRLQEQMEVVSEGFRRHSGMQLHLDALTHQYKELNQSMAALSAAAQGLTECVQHLQQQQRGGQPAGGGGINSWLLQAGSSSTSPAGLVAAGAVAAVAVAAAMSAALLRTRR